MKGYLQFQGHVGLIGSRAKGNYQPGSDIDLTLMGDALDFQVLSSVASALDESDIPYTVDVSVFDRLEQSHPDWQ